MSADELKASAIRYVNNIIGHGETVTLSELMEMLQDDGATESESRDASQSAFDSFDMKAESPAAALAHAAELTQYRERRSAPFTDASCCETLGNKEAKVTIAKHEEFRQSIVSPDHSFDDIDAEVAERPPSMRKSGDVSRLLNLLDELEGGAS